MENILFEDYSGGIFKDEKWNIYVLFFIGLLPVLVITLDFFDRVRDGPQVALSRYPVIAFVVIYMVVLISISRFFSEFKTLRVYRNGIAINDRFMDFKEAKHIKLKPNEPELRKEFTVTASGKNRFLAYELDDGNGFSKAMEKAGFVVGKGKHGAYLFFK